MNMASLSRRWMSRQSDALILAVPHKVYAENGVLEPAALHARFAVPDKALLLDVKGCLSPSAVQAEGMAYWRL